MNNNTTVNADEIRKKIEEYEGLAEAAKKAKKTAEDNLKKVKDYRETCDDIEKKLDDVANGLNYIENEQYNRITDSCVKMTAPAQSVLDAMHIKDRNLLPGMGGRLDSAYACLSTLKKSYDGLIEQYKNDIKTQDGNYDYYKGLAKEEKKKL